MTRKNLQTWNIIAALARLRPKKAGLSYQLEGACSILAAIAPFLTDRQMIGRAIVGACKRFKLGDLNRAKQFEVNNRFAAAALDALTKADAEAEVEV